MSDDRRPDNGETADWAAPFPAWPVADEAMSYTLRVNGEEHSVDSAWLGESLLFVLRERLGMPGTKSACEQGECGACLVRFDDDVACACCVLAADAQGADIQTIESAVNFGAADVQAAMQSEGGVQCGFCTPGFVMAIDDLLRKQPAPQPNDVREALSGNLCRCTGYARIFAAVDKVAKQRSVGREAVEGGPS